MPKKTPKVEINDAEPMRPERAPPPLSAEGIAKLQAAVDAALRKRLPNHNPATDIENDD